VEHHGGAADLKASVAYVDHDFSSRYAATQAFLRLNPVPSAPVAFLEKQTIELWVAEASLVSNAAGPLRWLAGAFLSDTEEVGSSLASPYPHGAVIYQSARTDRLVEGALYGEVSYMLTPSLTVTGGLRWFGSRLATRSAAAAPQADRSSAFAGHMGNRGVAPKALISYGHADRLVYAQIAQGYRSGGFNGEQLFTGMGATNGPASLPRAFRPDELWSYEAGARVRLFDKRLQLSAALFHADWNDLQSDQYFSSGLPVTVNIGDGSNTGVEIEAAWRSRGPLSGRLALLLDDPQLNRARPSFPARADRGLPGVAKVAGGVSATYAFGLPRAVRGSLTLGVDYVGRSYLTFDGAGSAPMGGFGLVNMSARLSRAPWSLELLGKNLTDATGNTFSYGNPFSRSLVSQVTPPRPQNFSLVLTRAF
jgi:outer membrane receptor protein involved in Fe transport